ncbi:MAG TPA: hypothetical protein VE377_20680 [Candidatus Dormibacteraeota bacterium]|nr:hypothetical protein [Candidatus Dormibacteraeota bacterium]
MKSSLVVLLFTATALAQTTKPTAINAPGCGADNVKFTVKTDKGTHPAAQPDKAKAVIYFLEDDSSFESHPQPTTRLGVDGVWVGANRGDSYFYVSVDPGEHHLCASWQSWVGFSMRETGAAAHFTAEPGQTYYFRVRNTWLREHGVSHVELTPLDSDEGQLLASRYAFSTAEPK